MKDLSKSRGLTGKRFDNFRQKGTAKKILDGSKKTQKNTKTLKAPIDECPRKQYELN